MSPCNCNNPPPPPQKGPSEYVPSRTYPDVFPYMYWGGAPMHRCGCGPWTPAPMPPRPDVRPDPGPDWACPPKIYRNPPDVIVTPGEHVTVEQIDNYGNTEFIVGAVQYPVDVDPESTDAIYGDGTPDNPLGVYEFGTEQGKPGVVPGAEAGEAGLFLRGDGRWADPSGFRECTAHDMAVWLQEVHDGN